MKRGILMVGLLLSLGFNLGLVASLWVGSGARSPAEDQGIAVAPGPVAQAPAPDQNRNADGAAEQVREASPPPAKSAVATAIDMADRSPDPPVDSTPGSSQSSSPAPSPSHPPAGSERPRAIERDTPVQRRPPRLPEVIERLGLKGPQRLRFTRLHQRLSRLVRESLRQIESGRRELYREMTAASPDRERIDTLLDELARASARIDRAFVETALESRRLLDPRQERLYLRFLARQMQATAAARGRAVGPPGTARPFADRRD